MSIGLDGAVWVAGAIAFVVGLPSALSQGAVESLSSLSLAGSTSFLYVMDFIWGNLSLAVGAMLLSIFVGWVWGVPRAGSELAEGGRITGGGVRLWGFFIRWICPVFIFFVLLNLFGVTGSLLELIGLG